MNMSALCVNFHMKSCFRSKIVKPAFRTQTIFTIKVIVRGEDVLILRV